MTLVDRLARVANRRGLTLMLALATSGAAWAQASPPGQPPITPPLKDCSSSSSEGCVVRFAKDTPEASQTRGKVVFMNYCVLCHGPEGKGNGRAARLHTPPPFNLTLSSAPRDYIAQVVRKGGEAMGRGKGMPPWGDQLTDEQINDVLNYLFTIRAATR